MQQHNQMRRQMLLHYETTRHYEVNFHGFPHPLKATMDVEVTYSAATGKSFRVLAASGSSLLRDEVLRRAVQSEHEASLDPAGTELTTQNYSFELVGSGNVQGRPAYILQVRPLYRGKYLYRGKIWVDAASFALVRIEAQPAKNPSFWIRHTNINEEYGLVQGVWMPHSNRSETKVRFGGTAVLTIDYGTYTMTARTLQATATE